MAHHEDLILDRDELPQGFCLYTGFHAGILGSLLALSSIIGNALTILNDCLISASCQRQIDRHTGIVITLGIGVAAKAKANTQRCWNSISDIDGFYVLKQRELIFLQLLKILLLKDDRVLSFSIFLTMPSTLAIYWLIFRSTKATRRDWRTSSTLLMTSS